MWNMLIGSGGSIIAAGVIFLFSYWYNRKRQSDAAANEYTQLTNNITNLNSKLDNLNIKIDNESEARKNQLTNNENQLTNNITNLNSKLDNLITNNITNLNSKLDNLNLKIDNESEARKNQFDNPKREI